MSKYVEGVTVSRKRRSQRTDEEDVSGCDECNGMESKEDNIDVREITRKYSNQLTNKK